MACLRWRAAIIADEDEIRLDDRRGSKDEVRGCNKKFSKLVGSNMVGKKPTKIAQDRLMLRSRYSCHGKLSIKGLVTVMSLGSRQ